MNRYKNVRLTSNILCTFISTHLFKRYKTVPIVLAKILIYFEMVCFYFLSILEMLTFFRICLFLQLGHFD